MDSRIIQGTYSDFRYVKTRSVVQIIVEVPIEAAEAALELLGIPNPGSEKWVAVALLGDDEQSIAPANTPTTNGPTEKSKRKWDDMQPSQQAGIMINDPDFVAWTEQRYSNIGASADERVKTFCGVSSKAELSEEHPLRHWNYLLDEYRKDTGRIAEQR